MTRKRKSDAEVSNAEHERLKAILDVLADPGMMDQIRKSKAFFSRGGKGLSFEEVFGEPLRRPKKRRHEAAIRKKNEQTE